MTTSQVRTLAATETDQFVQNAVIRQLVELNNSDNSRTVLTANTTYFVNGSTGSNGNDGLTSTTPFATIQKAINTALTVDGRTFSISISVADGTYNEALTLGGPVLTSGSFSLTGNTTTPSNVVINATGNGLLVLNGGFININGFKIVATGSGLFALNGGLITVVGLMEYGACGGAQIQANTRAANIVISANYTVSGSATWHMLSANQAGVIVNTASIATLSGTPAFGTTAAAQSLSQIYLGQMSFSGSATGQRYSSDALSIINSNGRGPNFIPGSTAGVATNGGVYA